MAEVLPERLNGNISFIFQRHTMKKRLQNIDRNGTMTEIIREIAFGLARGFGIYFFDRRDLAAPVLSPDLHRH
jgi:hypothetical protein